MHDEGGRAAGKVTSHLVDEKSSETTYILLIDTMAQKYGKLPSEVLRMADTFDLMVFDVSSTYQHHMQSKQNKSAPDVKSYDQSQLQQMMNKVRK